MRNHGADVALYGPNIGSWVDARARMTFLAVLLHLADISNVAKPLAMAEDWAAMVTQGELARSKA